MSEPTFLTLDEVVAIHARSLDEHGGREGIGDLGLLESATDAAKNTFYYGGGDLFDLAASYAFHIAEAQAFVDGNKRTGAAASLVFLARNGMYARPPQWKVYMALIRIAKKKMSKGGLAVIFRRAAEQP